MKKRIIVLIVLFWVAMTALLIGLDRKGVRMLKKLLEEFARSGIAGFMATHSLLLAE